MTLQNRMGLTPTTKCREGSQLVGMWWMASGVCPSIHPKAREDTGCYWECSYHARKPSQEVWKRQRHNTRNWILELSRGPISSPVKQFESLSWLNLEVQSSWQGDSPSKRSLNSNSSIQMKTRVCSKPFSSKRIKKSHSPYPTFAVRDQ